MYEDRELVNKILDGNKSAFSILVKKYERMVWFIVSRMVVEEDEIKDICQEVFIQIYLKLEKFNFDSKLSTWIATIAYRFTLNHLKKRKKVSFSDLTDEIIIDHASYENTPHQKVECKEKKEYIHNMVNELPIQYRTIVTLYHLNGFSYKEIADITAMPDGTVKNYLFRARKILKDILKKNRIFISI
ncbi:MAG: sigma-70 family RNA polymerase sigma factor [Cytophagales bacterium]|nr:sigma-70 family RNA polymerase sigma factor [Cytophagales bacterium]